MELLWTLILCHLQAVVLSLNVDGLRVDKAFLRPKDMSSAYALVLSSSMDLMEHKYYSQANFLATQVWPSARVAALQIETYASHIKSLCELGCGPGLPSITAANVGIPDVWATDVDALALSLVRFAVKQQGVSHIVKTKNLDLLSAEKTDLPDAELYILSDVFESAAVARGAARICDELIREQKMVWVFAQSDRVQREVFLEEMKQRFQDNAMRWSPVDKGPIPASESQPQLWLADIDETRVNYE